MVREGKTVSAPEDGNKFQPAQKLFRASTRWRFSPEESEGPRCHQLNTSHLAIFPRRKRTRRVQRNCLKSWSCLMIQHSCPCGLPWTKGDQGQEEVKAEWREIVIEHGHYDFQTSCCISMMNTYNFVCQLKTHTLIFKKKMETGPLVW
jgi:hypothetical protein